MLTLKSIKKINNKETFPRAHNHVMRFSKCNHYNILGELMRRTATKALKSRHDFRFGENFLRFTLFVFFVELESFAQQETKERDVDGPTNHHIDRMS